MSRVKVEGVDQLVRRLNVLPREVSRENLLAATMEGAEVIRAAAAEKAPKERGGLAKSIMAAPDEKRTTPSRAVALIGPDSEHFYGLFVEMGHEVVMPGGGKSVGDVPPRPFLRPALDESRRGIRAVIAEALRTRLGL